ncbi:MAG: hypothetical protein PHR03_00215 [Desulfovibrionales bacterium]|nr:hypothetical protein [Desulfovibrionales bacterium]
MAKLKILPDRFQYQGMRKKVFLIVHRGLKVNSQTKGEEVILGSIGGKFNAVDEYRYYVKIALNLARQCARPPFNNSG